MCDDQTHAEDLAWLAARGLTRRGVTLAGGAGIAASLAGCAPSAPSVNANEAGGLALTSGPVEVPTPDGTADAWFTRPADGRHPGIILWPDIAGLRAAFRTAADRLAAHGFAVLAVNHYYRSARAPVLPEGTSWQTPEGRALIEPMGKRLSPATYASDATAFVTWLDAQASVDTARRIGSVGHCMTGAATIRTAAAVPSRVGAAASFHGGGLVSDKPDSPHLLIPSTRAAFLFAIAQNDDEKDPAAKTVLRDTAAKAGRPAEIEVYPARHGWTTLDSQVYDAAQADRAWVRARTLFATL